jgi:hypothetical protein
MTDNKEEEYEYSYSKFFNVFFHVGVVFNVLLVIWIVLVFTDIL